MSFLSRLPEALLLVIVLTTVAVADAAGQSNGRGRTVEAVLQDLRQSGVDVIYSSELVPADLAAPADSANVPPLQTAMQALAAHGLALRKIGARTYVVVRAEPAPQAPPVEASENLQEISVYASRYAIEGRGIGEPQLLASTDIQTVPGSHDDAMRALRVLPGLASNASARPYIRGSLSEDVLLRYDGVNLLDPFHLKNFQSLLSAIDPSAIDSIEVFSGGFPVRYGTRSGGVIDMAAPTIPSGAEYRVAASLLSAGVSSIGRSERWPLEWLGAVRRSTLDMLDPLVEEFGTPQFADTLGRLKWDSGDGAWTLGWLLLDDRLRLGVEDDEEQAVAKYRDEYLWLARDHRFGDKLRTRATLVATSAERSRSGTLNSPGVANGAMNERRSFNGIEVTNDWTFEPSERSTYTFGGAASVTNASSAYSRQQQFSPVIASAFGRPETESIDVRINPKVLTGALHAAKRHRWADFEAELGLRVDAQHYEPGGNHTQISPRLNLRYDQSPRTRFYASVGRFTQAQHVEEWRIEEGQQTADSAQVAIHSILGFDHETAAALRLGIEVYSKRWTTVAPYFDNLLDPVPLLPDLSPDRVRIQPSKSEASGLEVRVRRPLFDRMTGFATLTWSRVADDIGDGDERRSWDQPLALTTGLSWEGARASVSGVVGWHSGWPRTPYQWLDAAPGVPESLTLGRRGSERWGDFYSVDLRGAWNWQFARGDLEAVFEVTNSTNRHNECCVVFALPQDGASLRPEISHWLPFIVNFGVTYRWHGR